MSQTHEKIKSMVDKEPLFLFMKGNPTFPQCGFSNQVVQILKAYKVPFGHFDVLSDPEMRQEIKVFSDWPTFPQLYVKGELYGGCDIVREAFEAGDLLEAFQDALPETKIEAPKPPAKVQHIGPQEANSMLNQENTLFLDVRTEEERAIAKIDGFQILNQETAEKILKDGDKEQTLVFLCHFGGRSSQAADYFVQQGFQKVYNVAGGIDQWAQTVDTSLARY